MGRTNNKELYYFSWIIGAAALIWTVTIICSVSWNVYHERLQTLALAKKEALSNFNKDQAFRLWGTKHGGVYVPSTEQTPPNPHLSHIPDRDITLPSGKRLTLMNPAYMVRQMMADFNELYGIKGRITSLKPLNPANAPDAWEREALTAFEKGAKEFFEITELDGQRNLRFMQPMAVKAGCLKCHAHQGYKEGDIRGGVGVSVPMALYMTLEKKAAKAMLFPHVAIWLLGSTMLGLVFYRGKRFLLEQSKSAEALAESKERLKLFSDVSTEGLFFHDQGKIVDANPAILSLMGYRSLDEVADMSMFDIILPEYHELVRQKIRMDVVDPYELKLARRDGTVFPAEITARAYALKGRSMRVVSVRDITKRKQAEERLNQSERVLSFGNRISAIFMKTPDDALYGDILQVVLETMESPYGTFAYIDENGVLVVPSMTRDIWDKCKITNKSICFPRKEWGDNLWARCILEEKTQSSNGPFKTPQGHIEVTRAMATPIIYKGEVIGTLMVGNKATDYDERCRILLERIANTIASELYARLQEKRQEAKRKREEERLRINEERLSLALKAAEQGIYDLDLITGEAVVTPEYALMLGYDPAEFHETNAKWIERLHPADKEPVAAVYRAYVKGEIPEYKVEFRQKTKDGNWKWILSLGKIMERDAAGNPLRMIGTHTDITERRLAEEEIRKLNEELEQRVKERTAELEKKNAELERMNKLFVGRELRMIELKQKIEELEKQRSGGTAP